MRDRQEGTGPMRRLLGALRHRLARVPRPLLYPLAALALAAAAYSIVQHARFEYSYYRAGRALDREAFDEAGEYLATCLRLAPHSGRARFRAAQAARRADQPEFAEEQLGFCAELAWPAEAVELERRMLLFQRGEGDPVTEQWLLRCVTPRFPDRELVLEALAKGYIRGYQLFKALEHLDTWLEIHPDSLGARMRRGWVYERLDRYPDAAADYQAVLQQYPQELRAKLRLAEVLRLQGKTAESAALYEQLKREAPPSPAIDLGLAQSYRTLGQGAAAHTLLDALAKGHPDDAAVLLEQGRLLLDEGRDEEARAVLEHAIRVAPEEYDPHYQLFLCLQRLGDAAAAAKAEKKFRAIETDLKRMGELTEALQSRPRDADVRYQIAEIFLRRGEVAESAQWLEGVVQLQPQHPLARQKLVTLYEQLGKPDRARFHRLALPPRP